MHHSKWSISSTGNFLHNNHLIVPGHLTIIHLEDHHLYAKGLKECILPFFPRADILNISNGNRALVLMKEFITDKLKVDLVITDINHPGLKGDEFLQELRSFEKEMNVTRTPVMVISFVEAERMWHILRPGLDIVDRYLNKCAETEVIAEAMEDILYPGKK